MDNPEIPSGWSLSDKLAIALFCLAAVMAIVLFWIDKTPITAGISLALIALLIIYPILHFIRKYTLRVVAFIAIAILITGFGWKIWPKKTAKAEASHAEVNPNPAQQTAPQEPPAQVNPSVLNGVQAKPRKPRRQPAKSNPQSPVEVAPGSIVQNNSGGVNIQQGTTGTNSPIIDSPITIGSIPKDISEQDMNSIVTYLSSAPTKAPIKVVADQFSGNAPFPDKFYYALKRSGWPMLDAEVDSILGFSPPGKKFQGAVVIIKGEPLEPGQTFYPETASDPLNYIGGVLEHLHIPRILKRDPSLPDGQIYVQFEGGFPN